MGIYKWILIFTLFLSSTPLQAESKIIRFDQFLGVNAHLLWFPKATYQKQLDRLDELGLTWIRLDLHWSHLEPKFQEYPYLSRMDDLMDELNQRQVNEVVYLVGSPRFASSAPNDEVHFDRYAPLETSLALPGLNDATGFQLFAYRFSEMATRYSNVEAWQIWNEPNIPPYWYPKEDPVGYGKLVKEAAAKLPNSRLKVLGGMAYFSEMPMRGGEPMLKSLLDQGIQQHVDVVAYHPYTHLPDGDGEFNLAEKVRFYNGYMRQQGVKQIWATEFGWSTYTGTVEHQPFITELQQSDYLLKRIALMMEMDFERIFIFTLSDLDERATNRDRYYGLLDRNGEPKPAYYGLKYFLTLMGSEVVQLQNVAQTAGNIDYIFWWQPTNNPAKRIALLWGDEGSEVVISPSIVHPSERQAKVFDPVNGVTNVITRRSDGYHLTLTGNLQMLVLEE